MSIKIETFSIIPMKFFVFGILSIGLCSTGVKAQLFSSIVPLMSQSINSKTTSLANSNVAATGELGDYHINPASIGMDSTLKVTARYRKYGLDATVINREIEVTLGQSAISFSVNQLDTGEMYDMAFGTPLLINRYRSDDVFINGTYAYSFKNGLKAGVGLNYMKISRYNSRYGISSDSYDNGFSLDFGLIYRKLWYEDDAMTLKSGVGLSLTDFGKSPGEIREDVEAPLPTTLRVGGNIELKSEHKKFKKSLIGVQLVGGASKIMARTKVTGTPETGRRIEALGPFEALFKSWDTIERFNGRQIKKAKPIEQIWLQAGYSFLF
jgi:hypothetical protein